MVLELEREPIGFAPAFSSEVSYSSIFRETGWRMVADSGPPALQVQDAEPPCETRWLHMSFCNFRNWEFASLLHWRWRKLSHFLTKRFLNVPLQPEFRSCCDTFKACIDFNWRRWLRTLWKLLLWNPFHGSVYGRLRRHLFRELAS